MPKNPKRKRALSPIRSLETLKPSSEHYPDLPFPTPEQCRDVRDALLAHHGFPEEFAKYRRSTTSPLGAETAVDGVAGETVLDGLVSTLLSQNTTESNSRRAFESLKSAFPTWEHVSYFPASKTVFFFSVFQWEVANISSLLYSRWKGSCCGIEARRGCHQMWRLGCDQGSEDKEHSESIEGQERADLLGILAPPVC